MDKARPFEYVYRLPVSTVEELNYAEAVYDRQVLLNETWNSYALRKGKVEEAEDEHVKWITRTWEDEEAARIQQNYLLKIADAKGKEEIALKEEKLKLKQKKSAETVAHVMAFEDNLLADKISCRHNLYLDFDVLQQMKFHGEQNIISKAEEMLRIFFEECEKELRNGLFLIGECNRIFFLMKLEDRLRYEEEERRRIAEEKRRAIEEEKRKEEKRQRELEEAERLRKEAIEQAKILERKKREEERRAKARSERERLKQNRNNSIIVSQEENLQQISSENDLLKNIEPIIPISKNLNLQELDRVRIIYRRPEGNDIIQLIKNASEILSSAGDNSYVMNINKKMIKSTVICQNGYYLGELNSEKPIHLLGKSISESTAISISSEKLHNFSVSSWEDYYLSNVESIKNSRVDERCFLFDLSQNKKDESIIFLPLLLSEFSYSPYIFAISRDGANSFQENEVKEASKVIWELGSLMELQFKKERRSQLCQQCVEWLTSVTGCDNCYISLQNEEKNSMIYVAASPSHQFMIGKIHTLEEENNGYGISFNACNKSINFGESMIFCINDINDNSCIPFENQKVKRFLEGDKTGSLLMGTITGENIDGKCISLGIVFMDFIGMNRRFSDSEKEILKTAVEILANLLLKNTQDIYLEKEMKIDDEIQASVNSPIVFLKYLWKHTLDNLNRISPGQLLELARYLHPPPIIPLVIQATLIIALGSKPNKVEKWEDAREKVTNELLIKMSNFDPTDPKRRKRAFFIRARKILKGYGAKDVLEKGSFPASCFFSWTFAAILLRKHADILRKRNQKDEVVVGIIDQGSITEVEDDLDEVDNDGVESEFEEV